MPGDRIVIEKQRGEWPEWAVIAGQSNGAGLWLTEDEVIAALDSIADSYVFNRLMEVPDARRP